VWTVRRRRGGFLGGEGKAQVKVVLILGAIMAILTMMYRYEKRHEFDRLRVDSCEKALNGALATTREVSSTLTQCRDDVDVMRQIVSQPRRGRQR
jgi:hypothetical protein